MSGQQAADATQREGRNPGAGATRVRDFRQIVIWPIQLLPLRPGEQVQRHWQTLEKIEAGTRWRRVVDDFRSGSAQGQERRYKEFVTFRFSLMIARDCWANSGTSTSCCS